MLNYDDATYYEKEESLVEEYSEAFGLKFLKSIGRFSVAPIINFVLGIIAVVLLTRVLPPDIYGAWNLFNVAANLLVAISCLAMQEGFLRFAYELPSGWDIKQLLLKCVTAACGGFILVSGAVLSFYRDISLWIFHEESLYRMVLLLVYTFSLLLLTRFSGNYYRVLNAVTPYTVQQVGVQFFSKVFILTAVVISCDTDTVLAVNTAGVLGFLVVGAVLQRKNFFQGNVGASWNGFKAVGKFSISTWPVHVLSQISPSLIPIILANRLGTYEVGVYAATNIFAAAIVVLNAGFMTYWVVFVYKHFLDKQEFIIQVHNYMILCILFVFSGIIAFQHVVYLLIGAEYQISRMFFSIVISDVFFSAFEATTQQGIAIKKKVHENIFILTGALCIQFACAWYLIHIWGVMGAACAVMVSGFIRCILSTWRGQKYYRSIEKWWKSALGMGLIIVIATSNYIFADSYWIEVAFLFVVNIVTCMFFRKDILKAVTAFQSYRALRS